MIDAVGGMGERRVGPGTVVVDWGEGKGAEQCVVRERKKITVYLLFVKIVRNPRQRISSLGFPVCEL